MSRPSSRYTKLLVQCDRCERLALVAPNAILKGVRCGGRAAGSKSTCGGAFFIPDDGITLADAALNAHALLLALKETHFKPHPELTALPDVVDQAIASLAYNIDRETGDDSPEANGAVGNGGRP